MTSELLYFYSIDTDDDLSSYDFIDPTDTKYLFEVEELKDSIDINKSKYKIVKVIHNYYPKKNIIFEGSIIEIHNWFFEIIDGIEKETCPFSWCIKPKNKLKLYSENINYTLEKLNCLINDFKQKYGSDDYKYETDFIHLREKLLNDI